MQARQLAIPNLQVLHQKIRQLREELWLSQMGRLRAGWNSPHEYNSDYTDAAAWPPNHQGAKPSSRREEESSTSVKEPFSKVRRLCLEEERQLVEVDAYQLRNPAV